MQYNFKVLAQIRWWVLYIIAVTRVYMTWVWKSVLSKLQHSFFHFQSFILEWKFYSKCSDVLFDFLYVCVECIIQPKTYKILTGLKKGKTQCIHHIMCFIPNKIKIKFICPVSSLAWILEAKLRTHIPLQSLLSYLSPYLKTGFITAAF
jgi:hypothetical protein